MTEKVREIYQVVYCDGRLWNAESKYDWVTWYCLDCPLVGISNLDIAKHKARELKRKYPMAEVIIISGMDTRSVSADYLYDIMALRGRDAKEECPSWIFEREEIEKEIEELHEFLKSTPRPGSA